jgi:RNA polymerase sigma factor (sigma-70 family)
MENLKILATQNPTFLNKALERIRAKKVQILPFENEKYVVTDYKEENSDNFMLKEKIYQSIRQLPKQCQLIFVKAKIDGLSYKEIAVDLGLSVKTIENQMSKALKLVKESVRK